MHRLLCWTTVVAVGLAVTAVSSVAGAAEGKEALGTIAAAKKDSVTITVTGDTLPEKGTTCELAKRFKNNLGFIKAEGWLQIARVTVTESGKKLVLKIEERKSKMTVNGKPVDHFKKGTPVKLTWK